MNTETLGVDLAHLLKWDGVAILKVARAALEDANFHTEALAVEELINAASA